MHVRTPEPPRVLLAGHSHAGIIAHAHAKFAWGDRFELNTMLIHEPRYAPSNRVENGKLILNRQLVDDLTEAVQHHATRCIAMAIGGNGYWSLSLLNPPMPYDFVVLGRETTSPSSKAPS